MSEETCHAADAITGYCIACGSSSSPELVMRGLYEYSFSGQPCEYRYNLMRCPACGLGRLQPLPDEAALSALYSPSYHAYGTPAESADVATLTRRVKMVAGRIAAMRDRGAGPARAVLAVITTVVEVLGARTVPLTTSVPYSKPKNAAILDFGCGCGWWLKTLVCQGFTHACAFDRDQPQLKELAKQRITVFEDLELLPTNTFDCIRLEHVAEHLNDPLDVLRNLARSLKQGGSIVLTVPDFGAWSYPLLGENWCLSLPHHVSQFTRQSLEGLARQAGLTLVRYQRLPIWEIAKGAFEGNARRTMIGAIHAAGLQAVARRLYYAWARLTRRGDYISVEMKRLKT